MVEGEGEGGGAPPMDGTGSEDMLNLRRERRCSGETRASSSLDCSRKLHCLVASPEMICMQVLEKCAGATLRLWGQKARVRRIVSDHHVMAQSS